MTNSEIWYRVLYFFSAEFIGYHNASYWRRASYSRVSLTLPFVLLSPDVLLDTTKYFAICDFIYPFNPSSVDDIVRFSSSMTTVPIPLIETLVEFMICNTSCRGMEYTYRNKAIRVNLSNSMAMTVEFACSYSWIWKLLPSHWHHDVDFTGTARKTADVLAYTFVLFRGLTSLIMNSTFCAGLSRHTTAEQSSDGVDSVTREIHRGGMTRSVE